LAPRQTMCPRKRRRSRSRRAKRQSCLGDCYIAGQGTWIITAYKVVLVIMLPC
jgi:hypothetical protein